jgi:hypothetical protein
MCRAWKPTPPSGRAGSRAVTPPELCGSGSAVRDREGFLAQRRASADVEVLLAAVAVVAEVEDLVVGQTADSPTGVGVLGDMDPQCGAALAGVAEVAFDGGWVIGDGTGDAPSEAALGLEPLPAARSCWLV